MLASARKLLCLVLIASLALLQQAAAQQSPSPAPGSTVPIQVTQAHTVFVSNAGGDPLFSYFTGGTDRAYKDLYASLRQWPRVTLVSTPQQADLILEVRSLANASSTGGTDSTPTYTPELQLRLLDPASRTTLWTLNSYLHGGLIRQKTRDKTLDQAASVLITQLRQLMGEHLTPAEAKAAARRPGPSRRSLYIGIGIAVVAAVVPLAIVLSMRHDTPKLSNPTPLPCAPPFCPI